MKLRNIQHLGRFEDTQTGKQVNVKVGTLFDRGTDIYFYLYKGSRKVISTKDFFERYKQIAAPAIR